MLQSETSCPKRSSTFFLRLAAFLCPGKIFQQISASKFSLAAFSPQEVVIVGLYMLMNVCVYACITEVVHFEKNPDTHKITKKKQLCLQKDVS